MGCVLPGSVHEPGDLLRRMADGDKSAVADGPIHLANPGRHSRRDDLTEEFVDRYRQGENPSVNEFAVRCPELANDIRDLFPGLLLMEDVRPKAVEGESGPFAGIASRPVLEQLGDYRIVREIGRAAWGSCTKRNSSHWAGMSRSRCCQRTAC